MRLAILIIDTREPAAADTLADLRAILAENRCRAKGTVRKVIIAVEPQRVVETEGVEVANG